MVVATGLAPCIVVDLARRGSIPALAPKMRSSCGLSIRRSENTSIEQAAKFFHAVATRYGHTTSCSTPALMARS